MKPACGYVSMCMDAWPIAIASQLKLVPIICTLDHAGVE